MSKRIRPCPHTPKHIQWEECAAATRRSALDWANPGAVPAPRPDPEWDATEEEWDATEEATDIVFERVNDFKERYSFAGYIAQKLRDAYDRGQRTPGSTCPCTLIEPCSNRCTCANSVMSGGCQRCASYGSRDQQLAAAQFIAQAVVEKRAVPNRIPLDGPGSHRGDLAALRVEQKENERLRLALTRIHRGEQPMHMIAADALWDEAAPCVGSTTPEETPHPEDAPSIGSAKTVLLDRIHKLSPLKEIADAYLGYALAYHAGNKVRTAKSTGVDRRTIQRWTKRT